MLIRPKTRKLILPGTPEWQDDRQTICNLFNELLMGAGGSSGIWTVKLWGAAGGTVIAQGGKGGFVSGTVSLSSGDALDIYVGNGGGVAATTNVQSPGGTTPDPNGGYGGIGGYVLDPGLTAGAGGGARTSLYLNGTLLAVAGAGGGAANRNPYHPGLDAGGLSGADSWQGGTQTAPGNGGGTWEAPGTPGNGPNGGRSPDWGDSVGGGGGGGYFGGGGGGSAGSGQGPGGGGSSYSALLGSAINMTGPNNTDPHFGNNAATPAAASSYSRGGPGRLVLISPTGQVYVFDYTGNGVRFTVP